MSSHTLQAYKMENITESNWTRWDHVEIEPKFHQYWFENADINWWYDFGDTFATPLLILTLLAYHAIIRWLKEYMRDREPYKLRTQLFIWNVTAGMFCAFALHRFGSELWAMLDKPQGFYRSLCLREGLHMSTAFWAILMVFSKAFFTLDTMFLLLRKKPVDAMHVIHHSLSMIFTTNMTRYSEPMVRWMALGNLLVLTIDYPILALRSLQFRVPKARLIMVSLEIGQMVYGLVISAYTLFLRANGEYCLRHPKSIWITYGVYIVILFSVIITLLSPSYWSKRGTKKIKNPDSKLD